MPSRRRFLQQSALMMSGAALAAGESEALAGTQALGRPAPEPAAQGASEFDVIIVGAGSAGCVLAHRMTAHPQTRVLVIEAGGPEANPLIQLPGKWTSLMGTALDWNFTTEPEPGLGGRQLKWPEAKAMAGRPRLTPWPMSAAISRASTLGPQTPGPPGATASSCRVSAGSKTIPAARLTFTGRWAASGRRHDRPARRPSRVSRSGTHSWICGAARVGLQRRTPGAGRGLLSEEHPARSPAFGSGGLSRARPGTPTSPCGRRRWRSVSWSRDAG